MGRIDDLNIADLKNCEAARKFLGYAANIPEDTLHLYDLFFESVRPHLEGSADEMSASIINGLCASHLARGANCLYRFYSAQMFRETRGAAEAAALAYLIHGNSDARRIFMADTGTDESVRKKARNLFNAGMLFPNEVEVMRKLKKIYSRSSHLAHTNLVTFLRHVHVFNKPIRTFYAQDMGPPEKSARELPILLFWLCKSHITVLPNTRRNGMPGAMSLRWD